MIADKTEKDFPCPKARKALCCRARTGVNKMSRLDVSERE